MEHNFISVEAPCHQRIFITLWEMPNTDKFGCMDFLSPYLEKEGSLILVRQGQRAVLTAHAQWTDWSEVLIIPA